MHNYNLRSIAVAVASTLMLGMSVPAAADSTDDIVNALIAKGVLTEEEGALLMKGRAGEKEAAEKKKAGEIKASFKDGIVFESGDKQHKISINGRVQADYRSFSDEVTSNQAETWDIRRAYLSAKGSFYDAYDFEVTYNGAGSSGSDLLYAWLNVRWWDQAQFKFGQFKQPFSMEELGSSRFINFTERSMLTQLAPAIDRGAQVHGSMNGFTYALGYFNGAGVNRGQNSNDESIYADGKAVTGRATVNIAELMGNKDAVFHLGAAYSRSTDNDKTNAVSIRTEGRGSNIFQSTAFTGIAGGTNNGYDLNRTGLEGAVAYGPVKFQTEWIKAEFEPDGNNRLVTGAPAGEDRDIKSWYAAVNWMITGESYASVYKNGLFGGRMKPKNEFNPKAGKYGWGAWEVGARYSKLDASDFLAAETADVFNGSKNGIAENGKFDEAKAWTLGLKWIPSPNTRFLLNYVKTDMDCVSGFVCTEDEEKAINLRAQFDF